MLFLAPVEVVIKYTSLPLKNLKAFLWPSVLLLTLRCAWLYVYSHIDKDIGFTPSE